jgi:hypothetical protein
MRANATILDPTRFGRGILHVPENAAKQERRQFLTGDAILFDLAIRRLMGIRVRPINIPLLRARCICI